MEDSNKATTESHITITRGADAREILRLIPTETGFNVLIPEGVTMTEAARDFVEAVSRQYCAFGRSKVAEKNTRDVNLFFFWFDRVLAFVLGAWISALVMYGGR